MTLKNRIIHWLGGYTKEEYDRINKPIPIFKARQYPVKTLSVRKIVRRNMVENIVDERWIRAEIEYMLLDQMMDEGFVLFETTEPNYIDDSVEIRAVVKVVRPDE